MTVTIETQIIEMLSELKASQKEFASKLENKIDSLQKEVNNKVDGLQKDITDLKVAIAKLESVVSDVQELKSTQKNQSWALISLLGVAVVGTLIKEFIGAPKL